MKNILLSSLLIISTLSFSKEVDLDKFIAYQESIKSMKRAEIQAIESQFYEKSWNFWHKVKKQYNQNQIKYFRAVSLYHENQMNFKIKNKVQLDRFQSQIDNFKQFDQRNSNPEEATLFVGSSSIVYWHTAKFFPNRKVINRGFGGASIAEVIHYYDQVIWPYNPKNIVIYSDIAIESYKSPEYATAQYMVLIKKIQKDFPKANIILLSMKPTLVDDFIGEFVALNKEKSNGYLKNLADKHSQVHYLDVSDTMFNGTKIKEEIFLEDGMHMNDKGYKLWTPMLEKLLKEFD